MIAEDLEWVVDVPLLATVDRYSTDQFSFFIFLRLSVFFVFKKTEQLIKEKKKKKKRDVFFFHLLTVSVCLVVSFF